MCGPLPVRPRARPTGQGTVGALGPSAIMGNTKNREDLQLVQVARWDAGAGEGQDRLQSCTRWTQAPGVKGALMLGAGNYKVPQIMSEVGKQNH